MRSTSIRSLLCLGILLALPSGSSAGTLTIPGTGACEAVLKSVAAAYERSRPLARIFIPPSVHSGGGIRQVLDGKAVLARVSRPLAPEESGKGLTYRVFARDGVVFAVGAGVTVRNFTIRQLAEIYSGKIETWERLGAGKGPIRVLLREQGDSSLAVIRARFPEFRDLRFTKQGKLLHHDLEMVEMLQKYRNSVGFATLSSFDASSALASPVGIDGTAPTKENVLAGRYPLVTEYALVYLESALSPQARDFVDFLFSGAGRETLSDHGLAPVER